MLRFNVKILGCGSATPTMRHAPTAQVVELHDKPYLIDCGEGTQLQMRRYKVRFNRLNHVFISHAHGDHCFGLPGLISTLGMLGRTGELVIHAPPDVHAFIRPVVAQFCKELPYNVKYNAVDASRHELVMEDKTTAVYTIPLKHRIPTCGYLFAEKPGEPHLIREMIDFYNIPLRELVDVKRGKDFVTDDGVVVPNCRLTRPAASPRRYAYCSDTAFAPNIVPYIEGVDCLYHEATFLDKNRARIAETFHSTAREAAEIARLAGVKRLVIGHYSARYETLDGFAEEAKQFFPDVTLANEGMVVNIG